MTMVAEPDNSFSEDQMMADRDKDPRTLALDRCDSMIQWYEKNKSAHRVYWRSTQVIVIILSGITVNLKNLFPDLRKVRGNPFQYRFISDTT